MTTFCIDESLLQELTAGAYYDQDELILSDDFFHDELSRHFSANHKKHWVIPEWTFGLSNELMSTKCLQVMRKWDIRIHNILHQNELENEKLSFQISKAFNKYVRLKIGLYICIFRAKIKESHFFFQNLAVYSDAVFRSIY